MKTNSKKTKRLSLSKETLTVLGTNDLGKVVGGDYFSRISACIFNPCDRE